jgi:hypothetical protein
MIIYLVSSPGRLQRLLEELLVDLVEVWSVLDVLEENGGLDNLGVR